MPLLRSGTAVTGPLRRPTIFSTCAVAKSRVDARRTIKMPSDNKMSRESKAAMLRGIKNEPTMSKASANANDNFFKSGAMPLFPATFVSAPLSQYPKNPVNFAAYHWARAKHWLTGLISVINVKVQSMDKWTSRPRWKAQRGKIGPTAKAMYREMLEAFAEGDKPTLRKVCTPAFADKLAGAIDRRAPNERVRFELVKYNNTLVYPQLKSHVISQYNPLDKVNVMEQAIVAIASTQRMSKYSTRTGETIPGTVKEQRKTEYVVLMRTLNSKTYEKSAWQIWGTTTTTTLEAFREQQTQLEKEQVRRAGWEGSAKSS